MMGFTAAYGLRLVAWGIVAAGLWGGAVRMSWRWWDRAMTGADPDARHRVVCGHFLALLLLPGAVAGGVQLGLAAMGTEISREPPRPHFLATGNGWELGDWVAALVAGWLLGALCVAGRLAIDAWRLGRVRSRTAPAPLAEEVRRLAARLPGSGRLTVRTADVAVPQVTGVLRPVLTVPIGFECLPAAEREAVLLHELVHAGRRDFAANLLQRLALAALWFQPAAWTLYRHVACEREARCDGLAVRHGASAPALARALVRLAEARPPATVAQAAAGRGDLRWRVDRLLMVVAPVPATRRWPAAVLGLLALGLAGLGGMRLAATDGAMTDLYIASALGPVVSVNARDPGGAFGLRIRRGQVLAATVEDRPLSAARIRQLGDRVTLLGVAQEPVVSLQVTPFGRIAWQARDAKILRD